MLDTNAIEKTNKIKYIAEPLFCTVWFILASINGMVDTDVFYLVSTGRYILEHGIPRINPFITTDGVPIVLQNWAYCALLASVEQILGTIGLFLMTFIFIAATYLVIRSMVKCVVRNPWIAFGCSVVLTYIFGYLNLRPEILTFFLLCLELYGLTKFLKTEKKRYLFLFPLSLFLEINFHASYWIMHYVVLLPYCVPVPFNRIRQNHLSRKQLQTVIPALLLSAPLLFCNPYGVKNITYVFEALHSNAFDSIQISELLSMPLNNLPYVLPILITILVFAFGLLTLDGIRRISSVTVWMWGGFLCLTVRQVKWHPFFALGTLYLFYDMAPVIEAFILRIAQRIQLTKVTKTILALCCMVLVFCLAKAVIKPAILIAGNGPLTDIYFSRYPESGMLEDWNAVKEIVSNDTDRRIYCAPPQYSHFFEYIGCPVYIDMRPELYTSNTKTKNGLIDDLVTINTMRRSKKTQDTAGSKTKNVENFKSAYLSAGEYASMIDTLPARYFFLEGEYRGAALDFYLSEHTETYEKMYEGKTMTLYRKITQEEVLTDESQNSGSDPMLQ